MYIDNYMCIFPNNHIVYVPSFFGATSHFCGGARGPSSFSGTAGLELPTWKVDETIYLIYI